MKDKKEMRDFKIWAMDELLEKYQSEGPDFDRGFMVGAIAVVKLLLEERKLGSKALKIFSVRKK